MRTLFYTLALCFISTLAFSQDPDPSYDEYYNENPQTESRGRDTRAMSDSLRMIRDAVRDVAMGETDALTEARIKRKLIPALQGFLDTEFMRNFYDLKKESEGLVAAFKAEQTEYHPRDVQEVKTAYEQVRSRFNTKLVSITNDFKDKKKQKIIRDAPDMYSSSMGYEMNQLKDFYDSVFRQTLADVRGSNIDGAIPIGLIISMIELASEVVNYVITSNYNTKRMTQEYLEEHLIQPFGFAAWDEIQASEGDIYKTRMNDDIPQAGNQDYDDPFYNDDQNNTQSDTTGYNLRLKKKGN